MQTSLAFPPPGNLSFWPINGTQSDLSIRQYLSAAATSPPEEGFGKVVAYVGDVIKVSWSADDYKGYGRSWYCMPCRQQENLEEADWASCHYGTSIYITALFALLHSCYMYYT